MALTEVMRCFISLLIPSIPFIPCTNAIPAWSLTITFCRFSELAPNRVVTALTALNPAATLLLTFCKLSNTVPKSPAEFLISSCWSLKSCVTFANFCRAAAYSSDPTVQDSISLRRSFICCLNEVVSLVTSGTFDFI